MVRALAFLLCLLAAAPAAAQRHAMATPETVAGETTRYLMPGPHHDARAISVWRPANAGDATLPVLYLADGSAATYIVAAWLEPAIASGEAPPMMIVGFDSDPAHRSEEYIPHWPHGRSYFSAHEAWVLTTVIPWAEQNAHASPGARAIGGVSNGADFAITLAAEHPDMFIGVLSHSPLGTDEIHVNRWNRRQRWALSAGQAGRERVAGAIVGRLAAALRGAGAEVRRCAGPWGHDHDAWRDISAGEALWALHLVPQAPAFTPLEQRFCGAWTGNDRSSLLDERATRTIREP